MPEVLKFEESPSIFQEFTIEPFHEEYIPGSVVLSMEKRDEEKVFFQIPKPIFTKMNQVQLEALKKQIHTWWEMKGNPMSISTPGDGNSEIFTGSLWKPSPTPN